jgi:hypothetical protein
MVRDIHPLAPEHLPPYIGTADGSDTLFTVVIWLLVIIFMAVGNLYLKLHAIPERMAHRQNNTQLQIITVLAILALLTHNNIFWVAALLLSVIRLPDFSTPINSIAGSLKILADRDKDAEVHPEAPGESGDESPGGAGQQER